MREEETIHKKEPFAYDRTLRDLLQDIPTTFVKLLTGKNAIKMLDSRFPNVEEKEADLIVELEDKEIYHIEVQSTDDKNMPQRMLYYALAIKKVHKKFPKQLVIYVGEKDIEIKNSLRFNGNYFSYEVKNIKDIDCKPLIESNNINDNILSILCNIKDTEKLFFKLKSRLLKLTQKQRETYIRKMLYLLRLRPKLNDEFHRLKAKELDMPFVIEKAKDPLYKEGLYDGEKIGEKRGKIEGKIEDAVIMVEKFKIDIKDVSRELKVPIEEIKKRLKNI